MDMNIIAYTIGVLCSFATVVGCTTTESNTINRVSSASAVSTETVAVSATSKTTTVVKHDTTPQVSTLAVDILKDAKKPCGTVAVDAPKFVTPETNHKRIQP